MGGRGGGGGGGGEDTRRVITESADYGVLVNEWAWLRHGSAY